MLASQVLQHHRIHVPSWWTTVAACICGISVVVTGGVLALSPHAFPSEQSSLLALVCVLACTLTLLRWLPAQPITSLQASDATCVRPFVATLGAVLLALFTTGLAGPVSVVVVLVVAVGLIWRLHLEPTRRELAYALVLGTIAMMADLDEA